MSWSQDYSVPSVESFLEHLTMKTSLDLLRDELARQGIKIVNLEDILLDDGMYQEVRGTKVTLSDGRVFIPKLVEKRTADGNWGLDIYDYVLERENSEVKYVDDSNIPFEYGLTDKADLASDGELEGESKENDRWDVENDGG